MKRLAFFFAILVIMFIVSFLLSLWVFPNWLTQTGWFVKLTATILVAGVSVVGSEIFSQVLSFLFDDKDFKERLSFVVGNKYEKISKILDGFTQKELGKEKNSKKYIPNVFVESTEVKEKLRYFSEPFVFQTQIVERLRHEPRLSYLVNALKNKFIIQLMNLLIQI